MIATPRIRFPHAAIVICAVVMALLTAAPVRAEDSSRLEAVFNVLAAELLAGITAQGKSIWSPGEEARIAIWPFEEDQIPVPGRLAQSYNDSLLRALHEQASSRFLFLGREELRTVVKELSESGGMSNPVDAVIRSARADVLILGRLDVIGDEVALRYKALSVARHTEGAILAVTGEHAIAYDRERAATSLDQGLSEAATKFANRVPDIVALRIGGVRYGTSRIRAPFGRYVESGLAEKLGDRITNVLTERKLQVSDIALSPSQIGKLRGVNVAPKTLRPENIAKGEGVYVLSGSFWEHEHFVDLRLTLRNGAGEEIGWSGLVRPTRGLQIRPPGAFPLELLLNDGQGPVGLLLTSKGGERNDPVYRIGEKLFLLIQTNRDAYLYCYYRQSDNKWFKIFPNQYHAKARIEGNTMHTIPGNSYEFDWNVTEPVGIDLVKCFATTRDVSKELPRYLASNAFEPLPDGMDFKIAQDFQRLTKAGVTEESLIVMVER